MSSTIKLGTYGNVRHRILLYIMDCNNNLTMNIVFRIYLLRFWKIQILALWHLLKIKSLMLSPYMQERPF